MWKFIGKTLAGMVLTKEAQLAAGDLAQTALKNALKKATPVPDAAQEIVAQAEAHAAEIVATNRAELIRQAMQVRASKQALLAELNEEDRAKLMATAMKAFLDESAGKG